MKARPRSVENKVAKYLSSFFSQLNYSEVTRIPASKRGPDIFPNELELYIDVKSRKAIPKSWYLFPPSEIIFDGELIGIKMKSLVIHDYIVNERKRSEVVYKWWVHMKDYGKGIPVIVLHIPGTRISSSVFVIEKNDYKSLDGRLWNFQHLMK